MRVIQVYTKWVFKRKRKPDGSIRYKARLVIRGFEQTEYGETYAPVSKLTTFRYMIAEAAQHDLLFDHLDVVTAFLNPEIDEDVYMILPEGIPDAGTIVKLRKALYGLKTAPRLWNQEINGFLISLGFTQSLADPNLYIKQSIDNSGSIFLILYVDDMQIFYPRNAKAAVDYIKSRLMKQYRITNLGPA